jgi:hypothetical protein
MRWSAVAQWRPNIATKLGNHSFRATGITAYLKNGGTLEKTAAMANHASARTTQLYDRRRDEVSLDEVERIVIWWLSLMRRNRPFARTRPTGRWCGVSVGLRPSLTPLATARVRPSPVRARRLTQGRRLAGHAAGDAIEGANEIGNLGEDGGGDDLMLRHDREFARHAGIPAACSAV